MTVSVSTPNKITANGNDSATSFSFSPMVIYASTDLTVTHVSAAGVETTLTEGVGASNYAVNVSLYPGTGSITYPADEVTPLPTGESLIIKPMFPLEQQTDLESQGGYDPEVLERQLDKLLRINKQQQELLDRALLAPLSTSGVSLSIPGALSDRVLGWNAAADAIENKTPNTDTYLSIPLPVAEGGTGAITASAALDNLGAGATGKALFLDATAAAARAELGSTVVGDAVFIAATAAAARAALGVAPGWILDSTTAISSQDDVEFTDLESGYDHGFEFIDLLPDSNSDFKVETSPDTGGSPTYDQTAGHYRAALFGVAGTAVDENAASNTHMQLAVGSTTGLSNVADTPAATEIQGLSGFAWLSNPLAATHTQLVVNKIRYVASGGNVSAFSGVCYRKSAAAVNAVRFYFGTHASNQIASGSIKHYKRLIQS